MARHAVIRTANGKVENVVELAPGPTPEPVPANETIAQRDERLERDRLALVRATWTPPTGCETRASDTANIGDSWNGSSFVPVGIQADPLAADRARILAFMPLSGSAAASAVNAYIADNTKDAAIRATMSALRSLIRITARTEAGE